MRVKKRWRCPALHLAHHTGAPEIHQTELSRVEVETDTELLSLDTPQTRVLFDYKIKI